MQKWAVAIGVLALLLGVIAYDEFGGGMAPMPVADGPTADVPPDATPDQVMAIGEDDQPNPDEEEDNSPVTTKCDRVLGLLTDKGGEALREKVGDTLLEEKGWSIEQLDEFCVSLEALSNDDALAKTLGAAGVTL